MAKAPRRSCSKAAQFAEARGAKILARIAGFANAFEACTPGQPFAATPFARPSRPGLRRPSSTPADVGHVNAHGLSTVEHDRAEALAIRDTLGDVPVTAPKSFFGNLGAGTGAVELIGSLLAFANRPGSRHAQLRTARSGLPDQRRPRRTCHANGRRRHRAQSDVDGPIGRAACSVRPTDARCRTRGGRPRGGALGCSSAVVASRSRPVVRRIPLAHGPKRRKKSQPKRGPTAGQVSRPPANSIDAGRPQDGRPATPGNWCTRAARDRQEDLEEVRKMLDAGEVEVATDECRWLLNGCSDCLEAHRLLGEIALAENDLPLARGHFGYAYRLGEQALDRAGCRGPAALSPAGQSVVPRIGQGPGRLPGATGQARDGRRSRRDASWPATRAIRWACGIRESLRSDARLARVQRGERPCHVA